MKTETQLILSDQLSINNFANQNQYWKILSRMRPKKVYNEVRLKIWATGYSNKLNQQSQQQDEDELICNLLYESDSCIWVERRAYREGTIEEFFNESIEMFFFYVVSSVHDKRNTETWQ